MEKNFDLSYEKALSENSANVIFYQTYIESYEKLISNLSTFRDTLEPEVLVPVCNRVLMKGNLIHTNEVTVSLGCGYFTKCSVTSAQQICKRRITKAKDVLVNLEKEREFLESQIRFRQENIYSENQKEIIEPYDEAIEKEWRKRHAVKLKEYRKQENMLLNSQNHQDVMQKLELLELQEDIERLYANQNITSDQPKQTLYKDIIESNEHLEPTVKREEIEEDAENTCNHVESGVIAEESRELVLRKKLAELRQRKKEKCSTEEDIFKRLDELEEEEGIEDELDRLYEDIYGNNQHISREESCDDSEEEEDDDSNDNSSSSRRVSFPKSDVEIKTINIYFKHSDNDPHVKNNSENIKIVSPSDVYKLFPDNVKNNQIKGIIKNCHKVKEEGRNESLLKEMNDGKENVVPSTVNIGNVCEHQDTLELTPMEEAKRPISKFKSMRMANKKTIP